MKSRGVFAPVWLVLWALCLSLSWLLPNHYQPWSSFHVEAWGALWLLVAWGVVTWMSPSKLVVDHLSALLMACAATPWLQLISTQLAFSGEAWLAMGYLGGFAVVMAVGSQWERVASNQAADALFAAIVFAALVSVGLQIDQWGDLALSIVWSMGGGGARPYANIGQPNMLSTFLIWGVLGILWGIARGRIGPWVATLAILFLLFGVALTQSRTGWLSLVTVYIAVMYWRKLWLWKRLPLAASGMALYFFGCVTLMSWLSATFGLSAQPNLEGRVAMNGELRMSMWKILVDATLQHPWGGYGWGHVAQAMLEADTQRFPIHQTFGHAHNLLLDLVVAVGWPLGLALFTVLAGWFVLRTRAVKTVEETPLILMVAVIGIHAMLELPLHYLNFLLPTGLAMGVLNAKQGVATVFTVPTWMAKVLVAAAAVLLGVIAQEYFVIEAYYERLRFEWANVENRRPPGDPPKMRVLTQLGELVAVSRQKPVADMTQEQIELLGDVARTFVGTGNVYGYAKALALNGRPSEAAQWLERVCRVTQKSECELMWQSWQHSSQTDPAMAKVKWSVQ